jgi:hypothetical protein
VKGIFTNPRNRLRQLTAYWTREGEIPPLLPETAEAKVESGQNTHSLPKRDHSKWIELKSAVGTELRFEKFGGV